MSDAKILLKAMDWEAEHTNHETDEIRTGYLLENQRLYPVIVTLLEVIRMQREALELSNSCSNAGQYGPLKISPGECANSKHACAPCLQKQVLAESQKLLEQIGEET